MLLLSRLSALSPCANDQPLRAGVIQGVLMFAELPEAVSYRTEGFEALGLHGLELECFAASLQLLPCFFG